MSNSQPLQHILDRARKEETQYRWLQAIQFYNDAVDSISTQQDYAHVGAIAERIGFCYHRAAMQAEIPEEFTKRMEEAIRSYDTAHGLYEKMEGKQKIGQMLRCRALTKYLYHWLTSNPDGKRKLLDECWHLTKEALNAFEGSGDHLEYCETYLQLSSTAYYKFQFQWDFQTSEKILREALGGGERTIILLSTSDAPPRTSLARIYAKTAAYLAVILHYFTSNTDEYIRYFRKAWSYWEKAYGLAADAALLELLTIPHDNDHLFSFDEILDYYEKALDYARITQDKLLIGTALDMLSYANGWKRFAIEDPDERLKINQTALNFSLAAKEQFASISIISPRVSQLWPEAPYCEYYRFLSQYETNLKKKRDLFKKASLKGASMVKLAASSGFSERLVYAHHELSSVLVSLARIAPRKLAS